MDDLYEDDEDPAEVLAAFEHGEKVVTARPIEDDNLDEASFDAAAARGEAVIVEGSGVAIKPKALGAVLSVRMPGEMAGNLRDAANRLGVSTSDLLRSAAERLTQPVGFSCSHVSMTVGNGSLVSATSHCGCQMQPIYATA